MDQVALSSRPRGDEYSQSLFDRPSGGAGGAGGAGGGRGGGDGDAAWGYSAFSPSGDGAGGGRGGGGFAEGELPVYMGGQRIEPGTEDIWKPKISRQAAAEAGIDPLSRGYTYDPSQGAYIAPAGGGEAAGEDPNSPFFNYAADLLGISQYI